MKAVQDFWRVVQNPSLVRHRVAWWGDYFAFKRQVRSLVDWGAMPAPNGAPALIVSLNNWVAQAKIECLIAVALRLHGWSPRIVTSHRCSRALKYFRAFGLRDFIWFDDLLAQVPDAAVHEAVESLLSQPLTIQRVKDMQYRSVNVGRQTLATLARVQHQRVDLNNPVFIKRFRQALPEAIQSAIAAEHLMHQATPHLAIFLDKDYMVVGSLYDMALNQGVDVVQWCGAHRDDALMLRRYTAQTQTTHPQSLTEETWQLVRGMAWAEEHEARLSQEFRMRYQDGRWASYYNRPYGKLATKAELQEQLGLDASKKTAVIFSHILWDSTFFWGDDLFDDYGEWLVETVRAACANPSLNWVVKLHPANRWKMKRDGVNRESDDRVLLHEALGRLPEHVKVLDPDADINTASFFDSADYCLTVRGTVGIEMACFGIPVFTAGTGRYTGLGFTIDSESRQDYLSKLHRIQEVARLTAAQTLLAKRYTYGLWIRRPWHVRTFQQVYRPLQQGGHPLDHNVRIQVRSFNDLRDATDLRAFAEWACTSTAQDYLNEGVESVKDGERSCAGSSV